MNNSSTGGGSILEKNCRDSWPLWTCLFGNVCGLTSTTLWFLVLLPQVWKNFRRKSVVGLSVLWATANFSASLINLFFVFLYAKIPTYGQISSVYCPILEFTLLIQFWIYGTQPRKSKIIYALVCFVLWTAVVLVELFTHIYDAVEWIAIVLWCIETFPQVILNMRIRSTSGQSRGSVFIAMVGKTTDFLGNYILVLPQQYVIMTYFSSSVAYTNGLQVLWYCERDRRRSNENIDIESPDNALPSPVVDYSGSKEYLYEFPHKNPRLRIQCYKSALVRMILASILCCLLTTCLAGLVWNFGWFGFMFPAAILGVLCVTYFTRDMTCGFSNFGSAVL